MYQWYRKKREEAVYYLPPLRIISTQYIELDQIIMELQRLFLDTGHYYHNTLIFIFMLQASLRRGRQLQLHRYRICICGTVFKQHLCVV